MFKTAIVIPDTHFPLHDQSACNIVLQAIEIVKPNIFINLGDVGEWESVSHWKYKRRKRPPLEYQLPLIDEEIRLVNLEIDKFDKVLNKVKCEDRYILQGNHDAWLDDFVLYELNKVAREPIEHGSTLRYSTPFGDFIINLKE